MRRTLLALAAVIVGSLLADHPHAFPSCDYGAGPAVANYDVRISVWPFGLECHDIEGVSPTIMLRPGVLETFAWIAVVGFLFAIAQRSAFTRGLAVAACYLALVALFMLPSEPASFIACLIFGPPLVFLADRFARPPSDRSVLPSLLPAVVLPWVVSAAWMPGNFMALEPLGVLGGLLAGGAVTAWLSRVVPGGELVADAAR